MPDASATPVPYFLARPAGPPPWPAVIVIMEGDGISPQLLRISQRLARQGYLALAPDLFHRFGGSDPAHAREYFPKLRTADALADVADCINEAQRLGAAKIGITGFCLGGRITYAAALAGLGLSAAAPFYGGGIAGILGEAPCPLLAFFGAQDQWIPTEDIDAVVEHHGTDVIVYSEAGHGFMRDGSDAYVATAAEDAWDRLLSFFATNLRD